MIDQVEVFKLFDAAVYHCTTSGEKAEVEQRTYVLRTFMNVPDVQGH